jgi:hypothetical protein
MLDLRRREFITLLGGAAAAWPLVARAHVQIWIYIRGVTHGWGWFSRRGIVLGGQLWHLCTEAGHHFCCSQHQASLGTAYDHDPR